MTTTYKPEPSGAPQVPPPLAEFADTAHGNAGPCSICQHAITRGQRYGTCEGCHHRHRKLECDHIVPKSEAVDNSLGNLQMLCTKEGGGCGCHEKKTYAQRGPRTRAADPPCTPRTRWLSRTATIRYSALTCANSPATKGATA